MFAVLQREIKEFHQRFNSINVSTIQCLEECNFSVVTLVYMLLSVSIEEHVKQFLKENRNNLWKSENHRKLFAQLDPYWDYFSFDLLSNFLKELTLQNDCFIPIEETITVYNKDMQEFKAHTTLTLFCQVVPHEEYEPSKSFSKMVTEYQWPETVTLEDINRFQKHHTLSYGLQSLAMMVNSIIAIEKTRTKIPEVSVLLQDYDFFLIKILSADPTSIQCHFFKYRPSVCQYTCSVCRL